MASRESQGLQIALILFVMVTVVLAVTTFWFYRSGEEARKKADAAEDQMAAAKKNYDIENFKVQYLLHILGAKKLAEAALPEVESRVSADPDMQEVKAKYEEHMATYGAPAKAGETKVTDYRALLPNMLFALSSKNIAYTGASTEIDQLEDQKKAILDAEKKRADSAESALQATKDELAKEKSDFDTERTRITSERQTEFTKYDSERRNYQTQLTKAKSLDLDRQKAIKQRDVVIADQKETIIEMRDEPFEVADGRITWVNQAANSVWLNLGLADGLRRQTLFSVYDMADNGVTRTERKASIEVTKVIDQHLSEARIVFDYPADPILPGDVVFSPAWRPGRKVRFALAGNFDIDGDRRSDRDLIRNLITMSGAVIDAEMHDDGTIEGQLTSSTRYLVHGERPTEGSDTKTLTSYGNMVGKAQELGVEIIPIDKLLSWMGYKPEVRTVGLGKDADPSQFRIQPAEGKARTSTNNVFRERQPPTRSKSGSAYK